MLAATAVTPANNADMAYSRQSRWSADNERSQATSARHAPGARRRPSSARSGTIAPVRGEQPTVEGELGVEGRLDGRRPPEPVGLPLEDDQLDVGPTGPQLGGKPLGLVEGDDRVVGTLEEEHPTHQVPGMVDRRPVPVDGGRRRKRPHQACLLYTSDAADDLLCVDLGGRRIIKNK